MYAQPTTFQFAVIVSIVLLVVAMVLFTIGVIVNKKSRLVGLIFMTAGFFAIAMIAFVFYAALNDFK